MTTFKALLVEERKLARKLVVEGKGEIWVPRSVTERFTKFGNTKDAQGRVQVIIGVADWFAEKEKL